jgi:hypothetical protein
MWVLLLFHCNNGYANARQCYVMSTLPILLRKSIKFHLNITCLYPKKEGRKGRRLETLRNKIGVKYLTSFYRYVLINFKFLKSGTLLVTLDLLCCAFHLRLNLQLSMYFLIPHKIYILFSSFQRHCVKATVRSKLPGLRNKLLFVWNVWSDTWSIFIARQRCMKCVIVCGHRNTSQWRHRHRIATGYFNRHTQNTLLESTF